MPLVHRHALIEFIMEIDDYRKLMQPLSDTYAKIDSLYGLPVFARIITREVDV